MALVKTAGIDIGSSIDTIDVTFEASLFADSLKARKTVAGLGSRNLLTPICTAENMTAVAAAQPLFADHDDDADVPAGSLQCTCTTKPTTDMRFRVFVMRK